MSIEGVVPKAIMPKVAVPKVVTPKLVTPLVKTLEESSTKGDKGKAPKRTRDKEKDKRIGRTQNI
jgi:hypothetical protein